jgi:predicted permease
MKKFNTLNDARPSKQKQTSFAIYGLLACVLLFILAASQTNYVTDAPASNTQGAIFMIFIALVGMLLFISSLVSIRKE